MSRVLLLQADARCLPLPDACVDAVVCDPPYHLTQVSRGGSPRQPGSGPFGRVHVGQRGFMGKTWDGGGVAFDPATWAEIGRTLKPGGRLLAFGAPRTMHRIWCAIEDAGFVIEDTVMWLFGSGFPKHKSKLKPAYEPVCVARKGPVSELNIDSARIATEPGADLGGGRISSRSDGWDRPWKSDPEAVAAARARAAVATAKAEMLGRWPANVALDEEAAKAVAAKSDGVVHGDSGGASRFFYCAKASREERERGLESAPRKPGGSNAKGFTADVERGIDRNRPVANHHPTVKPIALMAWLIRLVTQPGDVVLDPFMGSGSTGIACVQEGRRFIGCELDADQQGYIEIARRRIGAAPLSLFGDEVRVA